MGKLNIYPCFKCGEWFDTVAEQKAHVCGVKASPTKTEETVNVEDIEEVVEDVEESAEEITNELGSKEDGGTEFNRDEAVEKLKEAGVIKDKRTVTRKSDEDLIEMLKEIEA